ncbi:MAG: type I asparaginase [Bacteroidetes bacterium]|nr:type I asparaginase [Bacteroidota bacterium]
MGNKPSILVIYTGGTIGMIQHPNSGTLQPFNFDDIYSQVPVLENINANIEFLKFESLIDSSNMHPDFWIKLTSVIENKFDDYQGFVILHGTDTMAYTASALSFMLENLNKPVILTGSQLPLGIIRTDGRDNLINSIEIAMALKDGNPIVPEVAIYFENRLLRGNRTTKTNAENFSAFISGNYPSLAEVGVRIKYNYNFISRTNSKKLKVHKELDYNVAILKLFPGISQHIVSSTLNTSNLKAVILESFGSGNAPTDKWFIKQLENAIKRNILIFNVTQCKEGSVEIGKYETSVDLGKIGVIGGFDITTETAIAKLMYLLGAKHNSGQMKKLLTTSLRGEITI